MRDYEPMDWQKRLGYTVDPERCRASVHETGRGVGFHQCRRKPKDGSRYCSVHNPETIEARRKAADDRYEAKRKNEEKRYLRWYGRPLIEALRQIAKGHNDPRSLAHQILAENDIGLDA